MKFQHPHITEKTHASVARQLDESISIYDNTGIIGELEKRFSKEHNKKHALLTSSGTSALHSLFVGLHLKQGDEVIAPAYTFFATITPLFQTGATPVLVDCDETGNIDPEKIEAAITTRTKAIMITHMWGVPCDMEKIAAIAKRHNLALLEDFSHAYGATYKGKTTGSFGSGACSLQGQKTLTGGEGGLLVTDDDELYYRALLLGHYNKRCRKEIPAQHPLSKYASTGMGLKLRSHPLALAIVRDQLETVKGMIAQRSAFAAMMRKELKNTKGITIPVIKEGVQPSWYAFVMQYVPEDLNGTPIEDFQRRVIEKGGVELDIPGSTSPLNLLPLFQEPEGLFPEYKGVIAYKKGDFPQAEHFYAHALKLPVWQRPEDEETVKKYIAIIKETSEELRGANTMKEKIRQLLQQAEKEGITRFVIGAAIHQEGKILLLQRPEDDFMGGIYELPGGKVEGEETLQEAVRREVKEETGLDVASIDNFIDTFDYTSKSGKKTRQFNFSVTTKQGAITLSEHNKYAWVALKDLTAFNVTESVRRTIENHHRQQ